MMNLQFAPDWPVRCEFKFIMSLLSSGPRRSATGVVESRLRANGAKACNNMGLGVLRKDPVPNVLVSNVPVPNAPVPNAPVPTALVSNVPVPNAPCAECPCAEYW